MIHTRQMASDAIEKLWKHGFCHIMLIGSLGKGADTSEHDIDILIPHYKKSKILKQKLEKILKPKGKIELTDWGGYYFNDTIYGNVDIFFSIQDFDY